MDGVNYKVCILPRGLNNEQSNFPGGSVAVYAFKNEHHCFGKVLNLGAPPARKLNRPLGAKIRKIVGHLQRWPSESRMKIGHYSASWGASHADSFGNEYFGNEYISWYKGVVQSIPCVEQLVDLCQTNPSALSPPLVNVLYWLLVCLKEPSVGRISTESENRLCQIFRIPRRRKNGVEIFQVGSTTAGKTERNDLLRMEFGFVCEPADNVYPYLYHFSDVASEQYFVDKIGYPERLTGSSPDPFQTVLVVEYSNSAVSCFGNLRPKELDLQLPNVYYIAQPSDVRVSHVVRLKLDGIEPAVPRKIVNLAGDGFHLCGLFMLSAYIVYSVAGKRLLIL